MLSWFFKKREYAATPAAPALPRAAAPAQASAPAAASPDWAAQLRAAQGDDAALLRIAASAPRLEVKMAAVAALATEVALRQAEREFRSHDRKVHRLAKQRLEAAVAQREARVRAQLLLERAAALVDQTEVPINHVVELDHDWESLTVGHLEPQQRARFAQLRASLDAAIRERGEAQQRLHRWSGDARRLLPEWRRALAAAALQGVASEVAPLGLAIRALMDARPAAAASATADLDTALAQALEAAAQVESRLAWLASQVAEPAAETAAVPAEASLDEPAAAGLGKQAPESARSAVDGPTAAPSAAPSDLPATDGPAGSCTAVAVPGPALAPPPRWTELPAVRDAELAQILDQRHAQWLRGRAPASPRLSAAPPAKATRPPRQGRSDAVGAPQRLQIESLLQQAEHALAGGGLGAMQQSLQAIAAMLGTTPAAALPAALRARHQALRAEVARLKSWQQWGGVRAREDLVAEAEAQARQTQAATDPEASDKPKLNLAHHAQAIQALRLRWNELDRLSAAAPQTLWQRFDAALHTAFAPVAAQHAALKAARQENLAAREVLLAGLDALPLPADTASQAAPADPTAASPADDPAAQWKDVARAWHGFQQAWRKLGPVERTVPAGARQALQQRLRESLARIEAPLQAQQHAAIAEREQLIAQAHALVTRVGQQLPWHEAARQLRELQAAWQHQARQLPLPRAQETDLWARFRAATDALFAQRDAAAAAHEAELSAQVAAREALLARLTALGAETPLAEIERALTETDRAWRSDAELTRGAGEALEARLRAARAAALQLLRMARVAQWQASCDALATGLALCEEREAAGACTPELSQRWTIHGGLPAAWQQALAWRWEQAVAPGPLAAAAVDEELLQLEATLDLPATPEQQAERRLLKLRAMKVALEGRASRSPATAGSPSPADGLLALLRQTGLDGVQRARLRALLAALRRAPPGTLAPVSAAA